MAPVFAFDDVATQASMLLDAERVRAFASAIAEVVRPGDVVADVGAGSGILSILAAQAGARRVFAVERGAPWSGIAEAARANGVDGVVEPLHVDARDVVFAEPPNVIISETIGNLGLDEDILGLIKTVRARATEDCRVIPDRLEVHLGLAFLGSLEREMADFDALPVRLPALRARLLSAPTLSQVAAADVVAGARAAADLGVGTDDTPRALHTTLSVDEPCRANAVVGWFRARLSPSVWLASGPGPLSRSWAHIVLPLDPPLELARGGVVAVEVRPRIATQRKTWSWSASSDGAVRRTDAMMSLLGDRENVLAQLGIVTSPARSDTTLALWSAMLTGGPADVGTMTRRLRSAHPQRYASDVDAEQDVLRMIALGQRDV